MHNREDKISVKPETVNKKKNNIQNILFKKKILQVTRRKAVTRSRPQRHGQTQRGPQKTKRRACIVTTHRDGHHIDHRRSSTPPVTRASSTPSRHAYPPSLALPILPITVRRRPARNVLRRASKRAARRVRRRRRTRHDTASAHPPERARSTR